MSDHYTKIFPDMFRGSMYGAGLHVFATWTWALAHKDEQGFVEMNARLVAAELGAEIEQIEQAIAYLTAPDPDSRSPEENGRRMVKVSQFGYRVVNHGKYRNRGGNRTEYWRDYKRAKRMSTVDTVDKCGQSTKSTHADANADADAQKRSSSKSAKKKERSQRFVAPTPEEVDAYARSIGFAMDAENFCDYYSSRGWKVGNTAMKDWRAAVRTWRRRDAERKAAEPDPAEGMSRLFSEEEAGEILARMGRAR